MAIYSDPTVDYSKDKRRRSFEEIRERGDSEELQRFMQMFLSMGHDPNDPKDSMWAIMGVKPAYFDFIAHNFASGTPHVDPLYKAPAPAAQAQPAAKTHGHGKTKRNALTFGPEDD